MGGSDTDNLTPRIVKALTKLKEDFECMVVLGPLFKKNMIEADKRFIFKNLLSLITQI